MEEKLTSEQIQAAMGRAFIARENGQIQVNQANEEIQKLNTQLTATLEEESKAVAKEKK